MKGEVPTRWAELQELEAMADELMVTAFNLAPGDERRDSLMLIDSIRARIAAMKQFEIDRASTVQEAKRA